MGGIVLLDVRGCFFPNGSKICEMESAIEQIRQTLFAEFGVDDPDVDAVLSGENSFLTSMFQPIYQYSSEKHPAAGNVLIKG